MPGDLLKAQNFSDAISSLVTIFPNPTLIHSDDPHKLPYILEVPQNAIYTLTYGFIDYRPSTAAGGRRLTLSVQDPDDNMIYTVRLPSTIPSAKNSKIIFVPTTSLPISGPDDHHILPFPPGISLLPGFKLRLDNTAQNPPTNDIAKISVIVNCHNCKIP